MEYVFFLLPLLFSSSSHVEKEQLPVNTPKPVACRFFGSDYAVKLIRRKVKAKDEGTTKDENGSVSRCTFVAANGEDAAKVHFLLQESKDETIAKDAFDVIRRSNSRLPGFEEWPGLADEAIVHADGDNFQCVMIRKGTRTIRMKINPVGGIPLDVTKAVAMAIEVNL